MGGSTSLLLRALVGEPKPTSVRGQALWVCRHLRATRAWLRIGSYGWWRFTNDLKAAQRRLHRLRAARASSPTTGGGA